ncbi:MAG: hypothetical protein AAGL89_00085 [Pseudomonadota bacterium]
MLKIYGERNTGTNYLTALMESNFEALILSGRVDDRYWPVRVTRRLRRYWPQVAHKLHESARDRYFSRTFHHNLGWKHMNPDPQRIGDEALKSVRFVMVVKNPYAWLCSLFKRPYHVGAKDVQFSDFLNRRLDVMERRENIGPNQLTPVEVWNAKIRGYRELVVAADHAMIVSYEDFLRDEQRMLSTVAQTLQIPQKSIYVPIGGGIKRDDADLTTNYYADFYLNERWRDNLTAAHIEQINALLDDELVKSVGYEMI